MPKTQETLRAETRAHLAASLVITMRKAWQVDYAHGWMSGAITCARESGVLSASEASDAIAAMRGQSVPEEWRWWLSEIPQATPQP